MPHDYTTGEVARICQVAPQTVSKWFDSGRLKGYRVPGGDDRRIPRKRLLDFLRDNGMLPRQQRVNVTLFLSHQTELSDKLAALLQGTSCHFCSANTTFEAGQLIEGAVGEFSVAVVDMTTPKINTPRVMRALLERHWQVILIGEREQPRPNGAIEMLFLPFDPQLLATRLRSLMDI